jgi:hypothetical protein
MPSTKVRLSTYAPPELAAACRERAAASDISIGVLIRQALRLLVFADEQALKAKAGK